MSDKFNLQFPQKGQQQGQNGQTNQNNLLNQQSMNSTFMGQNHQSFLPSQQFQYLQGQVQPIQFQGQEQDIQRQVQYLPQQNLNQQYFNQNSVGINMGHPNQVNHGNIYLKQHYSYSNNSNSCCRINILTCSNSVTPGSTNFIHSKPNIKI